MINTKQLIDKDELTYLVCIPEEIQRYNQWVAWKLGGKDKTTKIPVNPKTGLNASTNDTSTWGTCEEALSYYVKHPDTIAGIGFVFTMDDPLCGVDLDDCRDPETGKLQDWAVDILENLNSYSEISPSQTGIKIFTKATLPGSGRNFGNIEMYNTGRYFTVTGDIYEKSPKTIEPRQVEITELYERLDRDRSSKSGEPVKIEVGDSNVPINLDTLKISYASKKLILNGDHNEDKDEDEECDRSRAIMSVVNALVRAGVSESDIFTIFDNNPIGDKYREKGATKEKWLMEHINKARGFLKKEDSDSVIAKPETSLAFPQGVITGAAGRFADVYSSNLESPREFFFMSYLTCLGAILAKRLTLSSELKPQPRLYTLLLGQSADDRKSTAIEKTVDFFRDTIDRDAGFHVCHGVGSAEGLQKRLEDTKEGLLLYLDEFKTFVSKCKIDSSVLLPCVNKLLNSCCCII
jgi:hypothetical protein